MAPLSAKAWRGLFSSLFLMDSTRLDIHNVLSWLVSADNMKMVSFVDECVRFLCAHLEEILYTHASFSSISDQILTKIAVSLNHNDLDTLRDKKDKIKSILFSKLVEKLLTDDSNSIFQCRICSLILATKSQLKLRCHPSQMAINQHGQLLPLHIKDPRFNAKHYAQLLLAEFGTWRRVYWHLWGIVNFLKCCCCQEYFRGSDLHKCRYHPEDPKFARLFLDQSSQVKSTAEIHYKCCQLTTVRFDPLETNTGCQMQDHTLDASNTDHKSIEIYADLLAHQALVCSNLNVQSEKSDLSRAKLRRQSSCILLSYNIGETVLSDHSSGSSKADDESGSDDGSGSEESTDAEQMSEIDTTSTTQLTRKLARWKWITRHGLRYNQDMQRDQEHMKLKNLKSRLDKEAGKRSESLPTCEGGIYARLEAEWKETNVFSKLKTPAIYQRNSRSAWVGSGFEKSQDQKFVARKFKQELLQKLKYIWGKQ